MNQSQKCHKAARKVNAFRVPSGTLQSLGASQQALRGSSCFSHPSPVEPNALTALDWFWSAPSRTSASPRGYSMALSAVLYSSRPMFCRNPRFLVHGVPLNLMVRAEEFSRSYSFRPTAFVIEEPPDVPYVTDARPCERLRATSGKSRRARLTSGPATRPLCRRRTSYDTFSPEPTVWSVIIKAVPRQYRNAVPSGELLLFI